MAYLVLVRNIWIFFYFDINLQIPLVEVAVCTLGQNYGIKILFALDAFRGIFAQPRKDLINIQFLFNRNAGVIKITLNSQGMGMKYV